MIVIIRDIEVATNNADSLIASGIDAIPLAVLSHMPIELEPNVCLLYTSDAADEV